MDNIENSSVLLSISLVVSNSNNNNNKDSIRRTMDSIKPMLHNIDSECIVVNMGSTDGTIDIVREYTENIISYTGDDLTEARNAGLKKAKGLWFLYLNEGEWFDDAKEIINFFNSKIYLNFGHAVYFRRSLKDGKDGFYMDMPIAGACRLGPDTHFEADKRPKLCPLPAPQKQWQGFVYRNGFEFFSIEEEKRYHRLFTMYLQRELKKKPDNLANIVSLSEEYLNANEYKRGEDICRRAVENYKWKWTSIESNYLMFSLIRFLVSDGEAQRALDEGHQIIKTCKPKPLTLVHIDICMIKAAQELGGKEADILELALSYRQNMDFLYNTEENYGEILLMTFAEAKRYEKMLTLTGIMSCCRLESYENLHLFLSKLDWAEEETPMLMEEYRRAFPNALPYLSNAMSQIEVQRAYLYMQRLICMVNKKNARLQEQFNACVDQCYIEKEYYPQVLTVGITADLDFIEIFALLDQEDWETWIIAAGDQFTTNDYIKLEQIVEQGLGAKNIIQYTAFLIVVQKHKMLQESIVKDSDFLFDLEEYCQNVSHYFSLTYQEAMFRPENQLNLPRSCRFALYMNKAFYARNINDYYSTITSMKEALSENPDMKSVVEGALLLLEEEETDLDRGQGKDHLQCEEFSILAEQIKRHVEQLILADNKTAALQLIDQLEMLIPFDDDVKDFRLQCED